MGKHKIFLLFILLISLSCKFENRTKINLNKRIQPTVSVAKNVLNIGVAAMLSPKEALPVYEEIVNYLGKKLGIKTKMIFARDYATMNEFVRDQKVFAAFVCSGAYVIAHDKWNMELLAAPSLYGEAKYFSYIIVNKKSTIYTWNDLKGKIFAFTDPESNTGCLVPKYQLLKLGETSEKFFLRFFYTGSHDKSIEAVAENLSDGAAVDNLIYEYIKHSDSTFTSKTRIITKLGPFCTPPFVCSPKADIDLKQKIKAILLNMNKDKKGKIILKKLRIDKFISVKDDCYKSVKQMNERLKINTE